MPRTVIVGDVHGCLRELEELLGHVGLDGDDNLYFVGDLVARGPDTRGVLALVRRLGAVAVRGNHEHKLLGYVNNRRGQGPSVRLGPNHIELTNQLSDDDWELLRDMPLWHDLPEHGVRLVHAGVLPGVAVEDTDPNILTTIRAITPHGEPTATRGGDPWGRWYRGPPHVVFGHNALMHPQLHAWATGIDLGCVYGGFLAALVLERDQPVPDIEGIQDSLITVPARAAYYPVRVRRSK